MKRGAIKLRGSAASAVKDLVMTDIENKTRAATADTSWGTSGTEMDDIARATFHRDEYPLVMAILWQRLSSRRWRCVYKALELLRYLCLHGSSRVLEEAREAVDHIQTLESFRYVDPKSRKDEGQNVRSKAKLLVELVQNDEMLEEERQRSKALKTKVSANSGSRSNGTGTSSSQYRAGHGYDDEPRGTHFNHAEPAPYDGPSTAAPGLDEILGLSEGANNQAIVPHGGTEICLISDDVDDDFDPRAHQGVKSSGVADNNDWASSLMSELSLESPSAPLAAPQTLFTPGLSQPLELEARQVEPIQQPPPKVQGMQQVPAPMASLFLQNLSTGAALLSQKPTIAPKKDEPISVSVKEPTDEMFGGLVDFKNLMLDKNDRPDAKKAIR